MYLFLYPTTADDTAHREVFHVHTICFFFYMDRQDHHAHREPLSMFFVAFGFDMFLFFSLVTILVRLFFFFARLFFPLILTTFLACQCLPAIDVVYISSLPHLYVTDTAFLIFMARCKQVSTMPFSWSDSVDGSRIVICPLFHAVFLCSLLGSLTLVSAVWA